jgi:hypothetical protein
MELMLMLLTPKMKIKISLFPENFDATIVIVPPPFKAPPCQLLQAVSRGSVFPYHRDNPFEVVGLLITNTAPLYVAALM